VSLLEVVGVAVLVVIGVVLFVGLPVLAAWKALPEVRRMFRAPRLPPGRAPINTARALMHAADRADAHRVRPRPKSEREPSPGCETASSGERASGPRTRRNWRRAG
jgi:hypothetical protein